jgi:hypothetical protein
LEQPLIINQTGVKQKHSQHNIRKETQVAQRQQLNKQQQQPLQHLYTQTRNMISKSVLYIFISAATATALDCTGNDALLQVKYNITADEWKNRKPSFSVQNQPFLDVSGTYYNFTELVDYKTNYDSFEDLVDYEVCLP